MFELAFAPTAASARAEPAGDGRLECRPAPARSRSRGRNRAGGRPGRRMDDRLPDRALALARQRVLLAPARLLPRFARATRPRHPHRHRRRASPARPRETSTRRSPSSLRSSGSRSSAPTSSRSATSAHSRSSPRSSRAASSLRSSWTVSTRLGRPKKQRDARLGARGNSGLRDLPLSGRSRTTPRLRRNLPSRRPRRGDGVGHSRTPISSSDCRSSAGSR